MCSSPSCLRKGRAGGREAGWGSQAGSAPSRHPCPWGQRASRPVWGLGPSGRDAPGLRHGVSSVLCLFSAEAASGGMPIWEQSLKAGETEQPPDNQRLLPGWLPHPSPRPPCPPSAPRSEVSPVRGSEYRTQQRAATSRLLSLPPEHTCGAGSLPPALSLGASLVHVFRVGVRGVPFVGAQIDPWSSPTCNLKLTPA